MVIGGPKNEKEKARQRLEMLSDTFLSLSTPSQNALQTWLSQFQVGIQDNILNRIQKNYEFSQLILRNSNALELLMIEGGWSAILEIKKEFDDEDLVVQLLEQDNVFVQPGYFYDFKVGCYLVISLLCEPKIFEEGLANEIVGPRIKNEELTTVVQIDQSEERTVASGAQRTRAQGIKRKSKMINTFGG